MKKLLCALLATMLMVATLAGCSGSESSTPTQGSADTSSNGKETLVVVTWGGALESALKASVAQFEEENNCVIQWETPTDYARVKTMVENNNVQWDVITCDPDFIPRGGAQGLLEEIDYTIVDKTGLDENYISTYGVGAYTWSTVISYDTDIYTAETAPQTWAEFWDTTTYNVPRAMYKSCYQTLEIALLADGVSKDELYPLDVDRALASLDKIKDSVTIWWESGAQPQQLMASKEVSLSEAWAGRIQSAKEEGAAVDTIFNEAIVTTDQWAVVKGTQHKDLAMKFINAITRAEAQASFSSTVPYGPVNEDAYALLADEVIATIPSAPQYTNQVVYYNSEYWAENFDSVNEKFQAWLLS